MSPELKSDVAELHVPLPGSAALPELSSVGNPCDSMDLGPSGDAPAWREAIFSQPVVASEIPQFNPSDQPFSFVQFMQFFVSHANAVHVGLGRFTRLSTQLRSRNVHRGPASPDLWPCPVPACWTGPSRASPRRRHRFKLHKIRNSLLQLVIATLNWEALGHPVDPPPQACAGYGFSDEQWDMVVRLDRLIGHFVQASAISSQTLGRCSEKFSMLLQACQELPGNQDVDLDSVIYHLASTLDPYSSKSGRPGDHETGSF